MSWGEGSRVYLGKSIGDEKRDNQTYFDEELISSVPQTRSITTERAEWRGMTKAYAEAKEAAAGYTIRDVSRLDDSGQWTVQEEKITYGEWTNDA